MNLLPLIFVFLVIFGGISLTFLRDAKSFFILESSIEGYHRTDRVVSNALVKRAYRKIKTAPLVKKENKTGPKKAVEYQSYRLLFPPLDNSKVNLAPLFEYEGEIRLHPLYQSLATFLRLLYQEQLFSKESSSQKIEYRLLDALLNKGRALKGDVELTDLMPDDLKLQPLYYKMLKGTNQYDQEKGFPPLEDYFCVREGKVPISFSFASPPLLEALFGKSVKEKILLEEYNKWASAEKYVYFSKEELQSLISQDPLRASSFSTIETYLDYSKQFTPRTDLGGKDNGTGIVIRKKIDTTGLVP